MFTVNITGRAEQDIHQNTDWWEQHRSEEQAERWYVGIYAAMKSLSSMPARCALAPEAAELDLPVRNLLYGLSSKLTHRVLFSIDGDDVVIYRVLHMSQAVLTDNLDLQSD